MCEEVLSRLWILKVPVLLQPGPPPYTPPPPPFASAPLQLRIELRTALSSQGGAPETPLPYYGGRDPVMLD